MKQQRKLRERLRTLDALQDAVGAMKSLSAHHFRLARKALPAARQYRETVELCLAELGVRQPESANAQSSVLLVASDLGLCGDYNSRLAGTCFELHQRGPGPIYCIGRRGRIALGRYGLSADRMYDAAASVSGLQNLLLQVAQDLQDDYASGRFDCLSLVSARFQGAGRFTPLVTRLLPIRPAAETVTVRPSSYVSPRHLAEVAVREYLYVLLHESLLDAQASEHGMRLVAAEAAGNWLESATASVRHQLAANRREGTTQELLDLIIGIHAAYSEG